MSTFNEAQVKSAYEAAKACYAACFAYQGALVPVVLRLQRHPEEPPSRELDADLERKLRKLSHACQRAKDGLRPIARRLSARWKETIELGCGRGASYHHAVVDLAEVILERRLTSETLTIKEDGTIPGFVETMGGHWPDEKVLQIAIRSERDRLLEGAAAEFEHVLLELRDKQRDLFRILLRSRGHRVDNREIFDEIWPNKGYRVNDVSALFRRLKASVEEIDPEVAMRLDGARGGCVLE